MEKEEIYPSYSVYPQYSYIQSRADSLDPDQMLRGASKQGLHCLPVDTSTVKLTSDFRTGMGRC